MPAAKRNQSFSFPGYSFTDNEATVTFTGIVAVEKALPALVAAQTGTLTTRSDDNTGEATLSTGHGIVNGKVDVYWAAGVRYGMDATVATNVIAIDGGAGDVLPTQSTACTVVIPTVLNVNFDGDELEIIGLFYRNDGDSGAKAHMSLIDAGAAIIKEVDMVPYASHGGLTNTWNIEGGDTNVFTGNRITNGTASHDSLIAGIVYICAGITS